MKNFLQKATKETNLKACRIPTLATFAIFCVISSLSGQTSVTVDANGNVINGKPTNFRTNGHKLMVDGVEVTGGGGGGGGSGLSGGTTGHVITASGATTIQDSGVALTDVGRKSLSLSQFTGTNLNQITTRIFGDLQSIPTTLVGYGITDAQPLDSDLTAIAALSTTSFGRGFLSLTDAAAGRTYLSLGTLATQNGTFSGTSSGTNTGDQTITLTGSVTGSGTGSFATTIADPELAALAGLTSAANKFPYFTASGAADLADISSAMRTFLTTSSSANFAGAVSDEVGYSTGAKLVFNQGPTIYDNAGTPKSSIDLNTRHLVLPNGTTIGMYWGSDGLNGGILFNVPVEFDEVITAALKNPVIYDASSVVAMQVDDRQLIKNNGSSPTLDWQNSQLINSAGNGVFSWAGNSGPIISDPNETFLFGAGAIPGDIASTVPGAQLLIKTSSTNTPWPFAVIGDYRNGVSGERYLTGFAPDGHLYSNQYIGLVGNGAGGGSEPGGSMINISMDVPTGLSVSAGSVTDESAGRLVSLYGELTNQSIWARVFEVNVDGGTKISNPYGQTGAVQYNQPQLVLADIGTNSASPSWTYGSLHQAVGHLKIGTYNGTTTEGGELDISSGSVGVTSASLVLSGNQSAAAWTTSGIRIKGISGTLTDTSSSGTVAAAYTNKLGGNTIAASSATTFTDYISSYFSEPIAGTNVTLTNKWGLGADSLYIGTSNPLKVTSAGVLTATSPVFVTPALGTPASGVVTNLTGTASININGTVGATTPTTGAFTTLTNTGAATNSKSGAASTAALTASGVPFAGTGTTSFPLVYLNDSNATASTTLSTSGTSFGINAHTGVGNFIDCMIDGASKASLSSAGDWTVRDLITGTGRFLTLRSGMNTFSGGAGLFETNATRINLLTGTSTATTSHAAIGRDSVNGITIQSGAGSATWNDPSTANSGTVANRYLFGIAAPTLTATGTSVTNTVASTVYIGGAPTDSTNTTSTTKYALNVAAGNTNHGGSVTIGGGTAITKVLSATATLDFGSTLAGGSTDLTMTVTGAALGDTVSIGVPNGSVPAGGSFFGWVSATNTVSIRYEDNSLVTTYDPASGTFRATVTQF